ncbi:MAG: hypothetical protein OXH52_15865 [Gammaproteobacteria bacterium]|nr:hypothetical protein [Gammaproteobacteria bacterium]
MACDLALGHVETDLAQGAGDADVRLELDGQIEDFEYVASYSRALVGASEDRAVCVA